MADRILREEQAREAARLAKLQRGKRAKTVKVDAEVQGRVPGTDSETQTSDYRDPKLYTPEIDEQIARLEAYLDSKDKKKRVGPAVSWGPSSSRDPAV